MVVKTKDSSSQPASTYVAVPSSLEMRNWIFFTFRNKRLFYIVSSIVHERLNILHECEQRPEAAKGQMFRYYFTVISLMLNFVLLSFCYVVFERCRWCIEHHYKVSFFPTSYHHANTCWSCECTQHTIVSHCGSCMDHETSMMQWHGVNALPENHSQTLSDAHKAHFITLTHCTLVPLPAVINV